MGCSEHNKGTSGTLSRGVPSIIRVHQEHLVGCSKYNQGTSGTLSRGAPSIIRVHQAHLA